ncbi:hypothetical protein AB1L42_01535 [Thalassoglobus sp. JC818]|uniref:hypothetical protein n=1 Tax=Thalassoglobus sp. JC818 TaxID=3232136 RepID=UPI00345847C1
MLQKESRQIDVNDVHNACEVIEKIINGMHTKQQNSPAMHALVAAKREHDPVRRVNQRVNAIREGYAEMKLTVDRLSQLLREKMSNMDTPEISPEAQAELQALKDSIRKKIRKRAEEEMARQYPEQSASKKRKPPRNRMTV